MQRKIIRQYYALSFLFNAAGMSVISATYVTFLLNNGLSLFQANMVNAVYFLTLFIFEIPTGAFADIFGRKTSFMTACGLLSVSMFVYGCSHSFVGFLLAETIGAIGCTFQNGAFNSWLVDSLKHHGYDGDCHRFFGRERAICQIGGRLGAIGGSYLAAYNPSLPWFAGSIMLAITAAIAHIIMREDYFIRGKFSWKSGFIAMRNVAFSSMQYGKKDKAVRFVLIITGIQIFAVQALNMFWQPFFKNHSVKECGLGYIFFGITMCLALGSLIASLIKYRCNEKQMILWMQIVTGTLVLITVSMSGLPALITLFLLHEIPRGCCGPLIEGYLQKQIPSNERATITSFCKTAPHISGVIGLLLSGIIAQKFGISTAWIVSGIFLIVCALLVARNGKN